MRWLFLTVLFAFGCTPSRVDILNQSPDEIGRWLSAGARIYAASGIRWNPSQEPCSGPGCAETVEDLGETDKGTRIGKATREEFRAQVIDDLPAELDEQTKVHELLHTLGVLHVTSDTVMNPIVTSSRDCISEAELWQLCHVFQGRCSRRAPECEVAEGWKVLVPLPGDKAPVAVDPVLWEKRIKAGKTLLELVLEARNSE